MRQETLVTPRKHSSLYNDVKKDTAVIRSITQENVHHCPKSMGLDFFQYDRYKNRKQKLKDLETVAEVYDLHDNTGH